MESESNLVLVTGGCRSGKSEYAEGLAREYQKVLYFATSQVYDEEFALRVKKHQERRPENWITVEEPFEVEKKLHEYESTGDAVVFDSLTGWITNLMYENNRNVELTEAGEKSILNRIEKFADIAQNSGAKIIVVADEVGFGLVPPYAEGRFFRDVNGKANQILARKSSKVYFVVAGIPLEVK